MGHAFAMLVAKEGGKLTIISKNPDRLRSAKADLEAVGATVFAKSCDVSNNLDVKNVTVIALHPSEQA
jgi:short-subunit dehydrogenase